jgi:putative transposase
VPLSSLLRRLLTGYVGGFNRRHHRAGHLFQNRFKSILVEDDPYLLSLVRYIHLNSLRAGVVATLDELDTYPWAGHAVLLGTRSRTASRRATATTARFLPIFGASRSKTARSVASRPGWTLTQAH